MNDGSRRPTVVEHSVEVTARQGDHEWTFTFQRERTSGAGTVTCVFAESDAEHDTHWCTDPPLGAALEDSAAHRDDDVLLVSGMVSSDVADVRIETETGDVGLRPVDAHAEFGIGFFAVAVADDSDVVEVVALDADGRELLRSRRVIG